MNQTQMIQIDENRIDSEWANVSLFGCKIWNRNENNEKIIIPKHFIQIQQLIFLFDFFIRPSISLSAKTAAQISIASLNDRNNEMNGHPMYKNKNTFYAQLTSNFIWKCLNDIDIVMNVGQIANSYYYSDFNSFRSGALTTNIEIYSVVATNVSRINVNGWSLTHKKKSWN